MSACNTFSPSMYLFKNTSCEHDWEACYANLFWPVVHVIGSKISSAGGKK